MAYSHLRDADASQDVVQDTFMVAWRRRHAIQLVNGSALPWLLTTARYVSLARQRNERRRRLESIAPESLADQAAPDESGVFAIRQAIAELPSAERQVVELVLIDGLSYSDAAAALGVSVSAAGKRLQRARIRLQTELRPHHEGIS